MTTNKRPIIDALKRLVAEAIDHGRLFLHTNTFVNCLLFGGAAFASNLSPEWLADHPAIRMWLPPALAAFSAVTLKISQQIAEKRAA